MTCLVHPYWFGSFQYASMCRRPAIKQLALSRWWSNWPKMRNSTQKMFMFKRNIFDATWIFTRQNIFKTYLCAEPAPSRWWSNWPKMRNNTQKMFMRRMDFLAKVLTDRFLLYWCHFYMDGGGGSIAYTLGNFTLKIQWKTYVLENKHIYLNLKYHTPHDLLTRLSLALFW